MFWREGGRENRLLLVRTMGCCTVAELDRFAEWNQCSIAESDHWCIVQSQTAVSCNV